MRVTTALPLLLITGLIGLLVLPGCTGQDSPGKQPGTNETAGQEDFKVKFETSKGDILVLVHPRWAPLGAARFRELVESGYYDGNRFFRVVPNFVVQFGLNGNPAITLKHTLRRFKDDPVVTTNARGTITFATAGPNTRTTQLFINLKDNPQLDSRGFSPFAEVVQGMEVVDSINDEYGQRPDQGRITDEGNTYLEAEFPRLDYIRKATIVE